MSAEAERWREYRDAPWPTAAGYIERGDALAAALEALERENAALRRQVVAQDAARESRMAVMEAQERRIAELEAGLRRIILSPAYAKTDDSIAIARDLLAGRADGVEG